jgi:hypothetical protein
MINSAHETHLTRLISGNITQTCTLAGLLQDHSFADRRIMLKRSFMPQVF